MQSLLFVPGNKAKLLQKACTISSGAIVPDLEDSVAAPDKADARKVVNVAST